MFTWICPQCGREVPPSYTECPDCVARQQAGGAAPAAEAAPPAPAAQAVATDVPAAAPAAVATPPPAARAPSYQPAYAVPAPVARPGLPTWLMSILFALAFIGLGAGIYFAVQHFQAGGQTGASATAGAPAASPLQNVPGAGAAAATSPLQKYIEVTGVRFLENAKKETEVHFVVVNHSGAEVADVNANVSIYGHTQKEGEEAVGRFNFKVPSLGPYESKDAVAPFESRLKVYELPDWQNVVTRVQVTGQ